jgi:hypothetical protein
VAHSVQWFEPALKIDRSFETYFALARDGKLNEEGSPSFWQLAVLVPHFGDEIRMPAPPWQVQKAIFGLLAPIGRMLGYQPEYPYPHGGAREGEEARPPATKVVIGACIVVAVLLATIALFLKLLLRRHRGE